MTAVPAPAVDPRTAAELRAELLARRPAYLPAWQPGAQGPDAALVWIAARFLETVAQRLNQAPQKLRLAFLDVMGIERTPAQAARVPLVFRLAPGGADVALPAGVQAAAPPPPGGTAQIVFETERPGGLAAARLAQVVSLWPGRDQWLDHSADLAAGRPFTLFDKASLAGTPHTLYLAHDTLLAFTGQVRLDVRCELAQAGSAPLPLAWEYWDGGVWRGFKGVDRACEEGETPSDGTAGLTRSGRYRLEADCAKTAKTTVAGIEAFWIRGRLTEPLPPDPAWVLPLLAGLRLAVEVARPLAAAKTLGSVELVLGPSGSLELEEPFVIVPPPSTLGVPGSRPAPSPPDGLAADQARFGSTALDLTKAFYPLGQAPKPGDAFYLASEEAFGKPGAEVSVRITTAQAPATLAFGGQTALTPGPAVAWEYWDGSRWRDIGPVDDGGGSGGGGGGDPATFQADGTFRFTVPDDLEPVEVAGARARWVRARLAGGGYGSTATVTFGANTLTYVVPQPPVVAELRLGYTWTQGPYAAEHVLTENDFAFADRSAAAHWPGQPFAPFDRVGAGSPALYLGFDRQLPVALLSLFFDVVEQPGDTRGPALVWEMWTGSGFSRAAVEDETSALRVPGMVSFVGRADAAPAALFGTALYWLRGRLQEDGPPGAPRLRTIAANAAWASQWQTVANETLGTSAGVPNMQLAFRRVPVLAGERVEVRELAGARANVEWRLLAREVAGDAAIADLEAGLAAEGPQLDVESGQSGQDGESGAVRLRRDRDKRVVEVWVAWEERHNLLESAPGDRHYTLERARGLLAFGDGALHGRVPPPGAVVAARSYRTGGGAAGNVAAGAVTQLLAGIPGVQGVANPVPAEGGADAETAAAVAQRGPLTLRRRGRAVAAGDYETVAREVSPEVAVARALPGRDPRGRRQPGWVTLVVIPDGDEPRPWPSFGLRERVRGALAALAPACPAAAQHLYVTGPDYFPVDVEAAVTPREPAAAGSVETGALAALARFLHPLHGGPEGRGWAPGRAVFLSDVAAALAGVSGLDAVREITLLVDGEPRGEAAAVPAGRIAVAGELRVLVE